ncbi:hypothetical protein CTI12_AA286500 [Artemisia annua]|uniref:Uncharacterized protein n=1 Tax=Artemisia annua TaxID=35608 RepID=A0A2U1NAW9_ARTAN|nr:hypothetical protein CTI12_AA286500 [Artemisia annua]
MANQLANLVKTIKSKVKALKRKKWKKPYVKMDKSSSVKVQIRSSKAQKLIDKTLRAADRPGKHPLPLPVPFDYIAGVLWGSLRDSMPKNQETRRECNSTNNHDMMIPNVGTRNWIKSLNLSITDSNCEAWYANGQEAGYKTTYARDSS